MELLAAVLAVLAFVVTVVVVSAPLRAGGRQAEELEAVRRADLEAVRDATYRQIREAEMDHRTGKLAEEDWRALDRELRAEAIALLRELDRYS